MSLKALHVIFILASTALSAFFGFWCVGVFGSTSPGYKEMGIFSFIVTGVLCLYLFFFISKIKKMKSS